MYTSQMHARHKLTLLILLLYTYNPYFYTHIYTKIFKGLHSTYFTPNLNNKIINRLVMNDKN